MVHARIYQQQKRERQMQVLAGLQAGEAGLLDAALARLRGRESRNKEVGLRGSFVGSVQQ